MDGLFAHIAQEKSPGPVRAFRAASSKAGLPEQGGLLIAQDAVNRQAVRQAWDALGDPKCAPQARISGSISCGRLSSVEASISQAPDSRFIRSVRLALVVSVARTRPAVSRWIKNESIVPKASSPA